MSTYRLNKHDAKLMGVCAGFADYSGLNLLLVRIGLVLLTLCALGPVAVIAYLLIGWLAQAGG